jgi:hypothetical protein
MASDGASPDQEDKAASCPLDAERERLRKAGYTDADVSQILIARVGAAPPPAAAGQSVLSGAVSSLVAIGAYSRGTLFSIRNDVAAMFDGTASAPVRAGATTSFVVKAVVIAVLGFAAWQEWSQHIVSAPAIAEAQANKIQAEAEIARQTQINAEQRQKAEAAEVYYKAEITKQTALVANLRASAEASEASYKAEIARQIALVADLKAKADAALADANAKIAAATSIYADRKAKADAEKAEGEARGIQQGNAVWDRIHGCAKACEGRPNGCVATCEGQKARNRYGF